MDNWIVYRYFPGSYASDLADFWPEDRLVSAVQAAGFRNVHVRRDLSRKEEKLGDFLSYATQRHRTSHLMQIDDRAYEEGIASIKEGIRRLGRDAQVPSELCLLRLIANRVA